MVSMMNISYCFNAVFDLLSALRIYFSINTHKHTMLVIHSLCSFDLIVLISFSLTKIIKILYSNLLGGESSFLGIFVCYCFWGVSLDVIKLDCRTLIYLSCFFFFISYLVHSDLFWFQSNSFRLSNKTVEYRSPYPSQFVLELRLDCAEHLRHKKLISRGSWIFLYSSISSWHLHCSPVFPFLFLYLSQNVCF